MARGKPQQVGKAARSKALNAAYRSKLALAKSKGLVKQSTVVRGANVSKYMRTKLNKLAPVLEGRQKAVKAPPSIARRFAASGAKVVNGRIIVENKPGASISVRKGEFGEGVIFSRTPLGREYYEEELIFPYTTGNVGDFLEWLRDNSDKLKNRKNKADSFAFKINGYPARVPFDSFDAMIEYLEAYPTYDEIAGTDMAEHPEFFTVYRVSSTDYMRANRIARLEREKEARIRHRKTIQDRRIAEGRGPDSTAAERMREYRKRHKRTDKDREKDKARALKYRTKRNGK